MCREGQWKDRTYKPVGAGFGKGQAKGLVQTQPKHDVKTCTFICIVYFEYWTIFGISLRVKILGKK